MSFSSIYWRSARWGETALCGAAEVSEEEALCQQRGAATATARAGAGPFFFQAEDGIRDGHVTGVQTCARPISGRRAAGAALRRSGQHAGGGAGGRGSQRSEERRVGKEWRSRWSPYHYKKNVPHLDQPSRSLPLVSSTYLLRSRSTHPRHPANGRSLGFFFQAEDGIRDGHVTGVQTCALPISRHSCSSAATTANGRSSTRVSSRA